MKIKLNWGWAIVIALASFMLFISVIVFQLLFKKEYDHELVSKNYYKDELLYQLEVDKLENAKKLPENLSIVTKDRTITLIFPNGMKHDSIQGTIYFQYVIDEQKDFELPIVLNSREFYIKTDKLTSGLWYISVDWKNEGISYLYKRKINL